MPNIRQQRLDDNEIYIQASDGRELTLTKEQIQAFYQTTRGNAASRRAEVIQWVKDQITAALGAEQIDSVFATFDFDPATGRPTVLTVEDPILPPE